MTAFTDRQLRERDRDVRPREITGELDFGLRFAVQHLRKAGPKMLKPRMSEAPLVIFTDWACDEETSIEGVLFEVGQRPEVFGCTLRDDGATRSK